jgi:hypothetical protein
VATAKAAKKKPRPNPFNQPQIPIVVKDSQPTVCTDPNTGIVYQLWVDPGGFSSGWDQIGVDGPKGNLPPSVGTIPPEIMEKMQNAPYTIDALRARSAAAFCNDSAIYNGGMQSRWTKMSTDRKAVGNPKPVKAPQQPRMDTKWTPNTPYYRPANFATVYDWMEANPETAIPIPPEYNFNQ